VANTNHQCKLMLDDDYVKKYQRSSKRWELKQKVVGVENYTRANHLDWIDANNLGVSHFGINPTLLPLSNIRFDTFHMKCSITRKLMTLLRAFILNQSTLIIGKFSALLSKFWSDFLLFVWRNNKGFTSFNGNELKAFVDHMPEIVKFMEDTFVVSDETVNIIDGLKLWKMIWKFISISKVEPREREQYVLDMATNENNLKMFYEVGAKSFLTGGSSIGGEETFYMHALRFYIPMITKITFDRHGIGIGIFNM